MKPIRTVNANMTYLGPQPEIADLPVQRERPGLVRATFALSDEDRLMIANGAQVQVGIWSEPMPPISISIVNEAEATESREGAKDYRCERCDAIYVEERAILLGYTCGHCQGRLELPDPESETE